MKEFKNIFLAGTLVLMLVLAMIIQTATPSKTVDFKGEIQELAFSDSGNVTVCAFSEYAGIRLFLIDKASRLEDFDGEKIDADALTEGTTVLITYRKPLFKDEEVYTVKRLKALI